MSDLKNSKSVNQKIKPFSEFRENDAHFLYLKNLSKFFEFWKPEKHVNNASKAILNLHAKQMFNIEHVKVKILKKARLFESFKCSECGELTSKHRLKEISAKYICIPCYNKRIDIWF